MNSFQQIEPTCHCLLCLSAAVRLKVYSLSSCQSGCHVRVYHRVSEIAASALASHKRQRQNARDIRTPRLQTGSWSTSTMVIGFWMLYGAWTDPVGCHPAEVKCDSGHVSWLYLIIATISWQCFNCWGMETKKKKEKKAWLLSAMMEDSSALLQNHPGISPATLFSVSGDWTQDPSGTTAHGSPAESQLGCWETQQRRRSRQSGSFSSPVLTLHRSSMNYWPQWEPSEWRNWKPALINISTLLLQRFGKEIKWSLWNAGILIL